MGIDIYHTVIDMWDCGFDVDYIFKYIYKKYKYSVSQKDIRKFVFDTLHLHVLQQGQSSYGVHLFPL